MESAVATQDGRLTLRPGLRAPLACLMLLGTIGRPGAAFAQAIAGDSFTTYPAASAYARCLAPRDEAVSHCVALGGGEAVAWPPVWGGGDPLRWRPGLLTLPAWRMGLAQRDAIEKVIANNYVASATARHLREAGWFAPWLQTRQTFGPGTRIAARILPGSCPASRGGPWLWGEKGAFLGSGPVEIDFGETDCKGAPPGKVRVTSTIHWTDASGYHSSGCPQFVPRRWMTVSADRRAGAVVFGIDGRETCRVAVSPNFGVPMSLIFSQNMRGSTATTAPTALRVEWWKATTL